MATRTSKLILFALAGVAISASAMALLFLLERLVGDYLWWLAPGVHLAATLWLLFGASRELSGIMVGVIGASVAILTFALFVVVRLLTFVADDLPLLGQDRVGDYVELLGILVVWYDFLALVALVVSRGLRNASSE